MRGGIECKCAQKIQLINFTLILLYSKVRNFVVLASIQGVCVRVGVSDYVCANSDFVHVTSNNDSMSSESRERKCDIQ